MKKSSFVFALTASIMSNSALAGTMGEPVSGWNYLATFSAGPVWQSGADTQTFNLTPEIEKTYAANDSTNALGDFELFLGVQRALTPKFWGQLGLAVVATTDASLSGSIWDDADPQFNNYIYNYKIQHTHVAAKGKLLADCDFWLIPWVSGSVGAGFNHAHSFSNTPVIFEAIPNPDFASHSETTFTYTVGAGVQKALTQNWQVGVGYEFADWGQSNLGRAAGQTQNSGLALNHLYTNGVLFNLTYIA